MKKITINVQQQKAPSYDIVIGAGLLAKISDFVDFSAYSKAAIITDTNIAKYHLPSLQKNIPIQNITITLPHGEKNKTIENTEEIWKQLQNAQFDRKSLVLNLGGGVIGDIGGFAASTYMRGVDFVNIPTTVLAQVDESVGGKTGIDFAGIKNLIGTFEQPKAVIIDVETLTSLPEREFVSGFAEIIKHGFIADKNYFHMVTAKPPREFSRDELIAIIAGSCEIKKQIVENDLTEKGIRKLLNFGHTIGHAIESISLETKTPLLHGEAISIGLTAEAKISQLKQYISEEDVATIIRALHAAGLPTGIKNVTAGDILGKIKSDKKNVSGKVYWTLLSEIGKAVFDEEVEGPFVAQAIDFITNE
jgi:3-dehydroquinate synthase